MPKDRRKKTLSKFGGISIANSHPFSLGKNGYQISPLLQELMVYAGQSDRYEHCNETLKKFINLEVSSTQVHRVTNTYGEQIGKEEDTGRNLPLVLNEVLYAQADGSMILTRDDGWKEVKLGRVFKSGDRFQIGNKGWIEHSKYTAHLGDHKEFIKKTEPFIESYGQLRNRLVFLSDGATWIKNWVSDSFPEAIHILDYYHASEHLYGFTENYFKDKKEGKQWAKEQEELLLESCVEQVIYNIKTLSIGCKETEKTRVKLVQYYQSNIERMDYKRFKLIGNGTIGSGAIEAANRTVVQERLKLSGQRWEGAQNVLNLRATRMSGQWNKVIQLVKTNFYKEAA